MKRSRSQFFVCCKRAPIALLAIAFLVATLFVQITSKPVSTAGHIAMVDNAHMVHDGMPDDMSPALCDMVCWGIGIANVGSDGEISNAFLPANAGIGRALFGLSQSVDPSERPPQSA